MGTQTILIVEDEESLQELLRYNLAHAGYESVSARSGKEALERVSQDGPALILLDLMLPDINGLELCKRLKGHRDTAAIPIIMLTARGEESDIVLGLEMGAEDYVTKPFNLPVLLARIRVVLRRLSEPDDEGAPIRHAGVTLHPGRRDVRVDDEPVELTRTQFGILSLLMSRPGWVFTRSQIVNHVRSEHYAVTERAVDVQIVGLRKKLGKASALVETVRGVGYRFRDE